ncbi:MAG: SLC13 family permease [Hyphomicrobiaceae bacterium]
MQKAVGSPWRWNSIAHLIAGLAIAVALGIISRSYFGAVDEPLIWRTAGVVIIGIALFATHAIPEHLTGLLVLFLAVAMEIAPNQVIFSGFTVGGLWLLFSGIIIGSAVGETGLGNYIARRFLNRFEMNFRRAVVLLVAVGTFLGFIMPATIPRIIILMPIALGLAEAMGYQHGDREYTGLAITVATGTLFPTFMVMTANLPTVVHISAIDALYGDAPAFASFLIYNAPISIFRALALIVILNLLFRSNAPVSQSTGFDGPMTSNQKRLLTILTGTLFLWLTDVWHGIAPAWIALVTAIVVLWPPLGVLGKTAMKERIDLSPVLYLAGVLCIGAILQHSGLDTRLGSSAVQNMGFAPGAIFWNYYLIFALAVVMTLAVTAPAVPIVLASLAKEISQTSGLNLTSVLMVQFLGFSTLFFPYQAPPLVVALSVGRIGVADLAKVCSLLALVVFVLGVPLNYLWWSAIGLIPAN